MKWNEYSIISACDQLPLSVLCCEPDEEAKGIVQLVHGMAEHKERYKDVMEFLADKGYICVIHDHRGHGKSVRNKNDLGYINGKHAEYMIEDLYQINAYIHKRYPYYPVYMFGHSMGSLVVRAYAKQYDDTIDALIVCGSPSKQSAARFGHIMCEGMKVARGGHFRSSLIQKIAFSSYADAFDEDYSENVWLCSDEDVVHAYDQDEMCGFTFTLNGFENLFSLLLMVYDKKHWKLKNKNLPIRFIAGENDPCIINQKKFQEAAGLMSKVGYVHVSARLFPKMRHEILNEKNHSEVYEDILAFIEKVRCGEYK